eukprot:801644_1
MDVSIERNDTDERLGMTLLSLSITVSILILLSFGAVWFVSKQWRKMKVANALDKMTNVIHKTSATELTQHSMISVPSINNVVCLREKEMAVKSVVKSLIMTTLSLNGEYRI